MKKNFNTDKFYTFLKDQAKLIRKQSFDKNQIIILLEKIKISSKVLQLQGNTQIPDLNKMLEALFEFNLALQIAYSNFRKENKSMWTTIFGWCLSKIPSLSLDEILKK